VYVISTSPSNPLGHVLPHLNTASTILVYLDRYHLGDPLFLRSFARDVATHVGPLVLVHESGEETERTLEARGLLTEDERNGPAARQLVERAIRDVNRRIVHELNDAGVSAVGVLGVDRGLLRKSDLGDIEADKVDWLIRLAKQGGVPVIGCLVSTQVNEFMEGDIAKILIALAQAIETTGVTEVVVVAFTTNRKAGLFDGGVHIPSLSVNALSSFPSVVGVSVLREVSSSVRVRVTTPGALREEGLPNGTDLEVDRG